MKPIQPSLGLEALFRNWETDIRIRHCACISANGSLVISFLEMRSTVRPVTNVDPMFRASHVGVSHWDCDTLDVYSLFMMF